ncbi:MAG: glycosyltransferase, partial [Fuerstiella sp.]
MAATTFTGWPLDATWRRKWRTPVVDVGVPLRRVFSDDRITSVPSAATMSTAIGLLVLGGSQGASRVNSIVVDALSRHNPGDWNLQIVHQTGIDDVDSVRNAYDQAGITADVQTFIDDV